MRKYLAPLMAGVLTAQAQAGEPSEVRAPGPKGDLVGTLVAPEEDKPVVLIIPGSGPTDRDGNNPLGVTASSYRLLAEALAEHGIGSVRIDKRGMFASKAAIPDPNDVTIAGYADDVHAWIAAIRAATGRNCVWVLGHSEGGLVALEAAQRDGALCGLVLATSVGRPFATILREQLAANPANQPILEPAMAAIAKLEAGERVDTSELHPALQGLFAPAVQGFIIDTMTIDPAELAARVAIPVLIAAGGKDLQISLEDADALAAAQPAAKLVVLPDMNHVLKTVEADEPAANYAAYGDPSLPIDAGLVAALVEFVAARRD